MSKPLSRTMQDAIDYAMQCGGKLTRFPGGFWAGPGVRLEWTDG